MADGSEHNQSESEVQRLNRALRMLSESNQALLRGDDEQSLMEEVCRIAVEVGGFRMAWVGRAEHDAERRVVPVAWEGHTGGYLEEVEITWADEPRGWGPTGRAIRTGRPTITKSMKEPKMDVWRKPATKYGYASSAAFPLVVEGEVYAAFNLYATKEDAFGESEMEVLEELAGDLAFGIHTSRDRGRRRQAEQAVKESEERYRALVDNTDDFIYSFDLDGRYTAVNRALSEAIGLPADEIIGKNHSELGLPDDVREEWEDLGEKVFESGEDVHTVTSIPMPDGKVHGYELFLRPLFDENGQVVGLTGRSRDVTEKKQAEEALQANEERHRRLVEHSPLGIVIIDGEGRLRYANPATAQILGTHDPDHLIGRQMTDFTGSDFAEQAWDLLSVVEAGSPTPPFEMEAVREDGSTRWVESSAIPLEFEGEPAAYVVIRDLTEQKRAEMELEQSREQLHQSQKLESVGRLAGGIAHDFNNILTVIIGELELVLDDDRCANSLFREHLEDIRSAAARAARLTGQLLAFSRKQPYRARVIDLNEIVYHMDALLRRTMGEEISIHTLLGNALWPVEIDPTRLEQAVLNLAVNARDAMPDGGNLTIETQKVVLDETYASTHLGARPGEYVMLAISDDGTGMDVETREQIFEPFFTTKSEGKGTGLGLSTVYGIVKQLGGNVWVYSEPGEGTTIKIYLPHSDKTVGWHPGEREGRGQEIDVRGTETVLVVEDEETVRRLAERILTNEGYTVLSAASGPDALEIFPRDHADGIDLLLTDVVLPQMSGREVAEALTEDHPDLVVLYMSGYTKNAIVHEGRLDDSVNLLEKPFGPNQLASAVRQALDAARS